jgi:hypothetical protein
LGGTGGGGRGGGAIAGTGMDGMANAGVPAAPAGALDAAAASPAGLGALTEMSRVYSPGPLGAARGVGAASSAAGRANAPVAPSEGRVDAGGFDGVGVGKIGGAGATFAAGLGATNGSFSGTGAGKTGAGKTGEGNTGAGELGAGKLGVEKFGTGGPGEGKPAAGSATARGSPADDGVVVLDIRSALNHPVNEPAGSFPASPGAGKGSSCCGFAEPNTEVKSPTVFCGACCRGVTFGISDGASPRNGP